MTAPFFGHCLSYRPLSLWHATLSFSHTSFFFIYMTCCPPPPSISLSLSKNCFEDVLQLYNRWHKLSDILKEKSSKSKSPCSQAGSLVSLSCVSMLLTALFRCVRECICVRDCVFMCTLLLQFNSLVCVSETALGAERRACLCCAPAPSSSAMQSACPCTKSSICRTREARTAWRERAQTAPSATSVTLPGQAV